jgi:YidC/Oxa1 family membrane protein insertase
MRQAPFFGWIHDLSAPDTTNLFTAFGLIPWSPPGFLHIGILAIIFGLSMWVQQKLNPAPTDPVQAKMMAFLPLIFTYTMASFPSGLLIYWTWSNLLSLGQQAFFNKTHPRG